MVGDSAFQLDIFVKWAHICYCISFFLMFCGMLNFYKIDKNLGPLSISLGYMVKDFWNFFYLLVIFMVPYGVMMQSLLYPNEIRSGKAATQLIFKPYMSLFGEMFKTETATYAFDSVSSCEKSVDVLQVPSDKYVYNPDGITYVYQTTDSSKFTIKSLGDGEFHPLNGLEWYRPNHWSEVSNDNFENNTGLCESDRWNASSTEKSGCISIAIVGLLEIDKVSSISRLYDLDKTLH